MAKDRGRFADQLKGVSETVKQQVRDLPKPSPKKETQR
jgi:hypothetical protein